MRNKYVVAVSGGVDSMYLASLLADKNQAAAFVHINHHTRGSANDYEQKLVTDLGVKYKVPVYVFDYYHDNGNFQAKARAFRYQQLVSVANKYSRKIATAHHLDDQLENCLIPSHLVKSNLIEYLTDYQNCQIYRPLLALKKKQIYDLANQMNIEYNEDISNQQPTYERNKHRQLLQTSKYQHQAMINYIVEYSKPQLKIVANPKPLDRKLLVAQSHYYRLFKIYQYLKSYNPNLNVKNRQLISINRLLDMKKNSKYSIANCSELFIGYDKIYMLASDEKIITESILQVGKNEFNGIEFYSDTNQGKIRTWETGDRVQLINGHKKVGRIFIDNKIESHLRKRWPIVINNDGEIISIPNIWRKNEIN